MRLTIVALAVGFALMGVVFAVAGVGIVAGLYLVPAVILLFVAIIPAKNHSPRNHFQ